MSIKIIGTSHVSPESLQEIKEAIEKEKPNCVAIEADPGRFEALRRGEKITLKTARVIGFRNYVIAKVFSTIQRRLGRRTGVMPGQEMLIAAKFASESGADLALIDRDIRITLNRLKAMTLREKLGIFLSFFKGFQKGEKIDLRKVPEEEMVKEVTTYLKKLSPILYKVLIEERDLHMAKALIQLSKKYSKIVAVVGVGHKEGIEKHLKNMD